MEPDGIHSLGDGLWSAGCEDCKQWITKDAETEAQARRRLSAHRWRVHAEQAHEGKHHAHT